MAGRIGIMTGLAFEAALVSKISKQLNWGADSPEVRCIGMGAAGAGAAAEELATIGVRGVVSFGIAGGIDPALRAGALVVPRMVVSSAGETWPADAAWRSELLAALGDEVEVADGPLLAGAGMLTTVSAKQAAWQESKAGAADMESGEIARAAHSTGMRCLVVRAVADEAATPLPPAATAMDTDGRLALGALFASLARRPGQLPGLISLGLKTRRACRALETVCRRMGPNLALS